MTDRKHSVESLPEQDYSVASMTECTGLMQVPAANDAEAEALCDIYKVPLSRRRFRLGEESPLRDHVDPDGM